MSDGQPSDAEVIQRCRRGEIECFRVLVERYEDRIYNLSLRLLGHHEDALDAAQETFVRAYGALPQFELDRPLAPWLYRIATNLCFGILRKRRPEVVSLDAAEEWEVDSARSMSGGAVDPQEWVDRAATDEEIQRAVLELPEPYRAAVLLRYMDGLSYEAIADALEVPLGTVKTYLHRARQRLRAKLSGT